MNYLFLKNILDAVLDNFCCPECQQPLQPSSLNIKKIIEHTIDLQACCTHCKATSYLRAELNQITASFIESEEGKLFVQKLLVEKKFSREEPMGASDMLDGLGDTGETISQKDIEQLENTLEKNFTIKDLMDEE